MCCAVLCCAVLCCAVLPDGINVLCRAALCCALPHHAINCQAVLYWCAEVQVHCALQKWQHLSITMRLYLHCRLYDTTAFQPKSATQALPPEPKPQRRAPSAGVDKPPAQAEPAAAAAAVVTEASAAAVPKPPRELSHAPKTLKEGHVRSSSAVRSNKESSSRVGIRDARDAGAKEGKEVITRDARDKGREAASRNGKERSDKPQAGREGRDSARVTSRAADDQQLADVRAAALKATVNGSNGDASKGRSPARRDELVNGTKAAAANGAVAVPGTKRRAPDSGAPESRWASCCMSGVSCATAVCCLPQHSAWHCTAA